jgi:hypothetical protein
MSDIRDSSCPNSALIDFDGLQIGVWGPLAFQNLCGARNLPMANDSPIRADFVVFRWAGQISAPIVEGLPYSSAREAAT